MYQYVPVFPIHRPLSHLPFRREKTVCNNKQYEKKRRTQIETVFFLPMLLLQVVQNFHFFNFQKRKEEKNSALRGRDERIIPSPHTGSLSPSPHSLFPSHLFPSTRSSIICLLRTQGYCTLIHTMRTQGYCTLTHTLPPARRHDNSCSLTTLFVSRSRRHRRSATATGQRRRAPGQPPRTCTTANNRPG